MLALVVAFLLLTLFAHGVSRLTTGESATTAAGVHHLSALKQQASILRVRHGRLQALDARPGRRIALTFDDGPHPVWTPRVAATLRRLGVPATFFLVGSEVAKYPEVVRRLRAQSFELGNHTFSHADVTAIAGWRLSAQVGLTDSVIAAAAGVRPRLMRPPYSSTPDAVTSQQERAFRRVANDSRLIALADRDSHDWQRPGVEKILRAATPSGPAGGVILMHDGGGDRSETVAALKRLVPRLKRRGFKFVTMSSMAHLPRRAVDIPVAAEGRARGRALVIALQVAATITSVLAVVLLAMLLLTVARLAIVLPVARVQQRSARRQAFDPRFTPPVTAVVPAYNEAVGIERCVRSVVASDYPQLEVIVVDDGSSDGTAEVVKSLALPGVRVIRQPNRGKAAALNRGVMAASHDILVMIDGDTVLEPKSVGRLVQPFKDPAVGAVSGNTKVGNRKRLLGLWQHIEYIIGFNLDRRLYHLLRFMPTVPGAIGAFRREALVESGGVSHATLAEDTDITLALGRAGWHVAYAEKARGWTEAPSSLGALWRQRYRWSYGTMQAVWKHRAALWRRGEGRVGRGAIPYLVLFQILLPMAGPMIDLFALYGLVFLEPLPVVASWVAFNLLQLGTGAYAFRLDDEPLKPLWALPVQQFVYRQLMYLVVIQSLLSALLGVRLAWQHAERTGDVRVAR